MMVTKKTSLLVYRRMRTRPLDATIYCAQALFRQTPKSPWEQQSLPDQASAADNMTSVSQFGRQV